MSTIDADAVALAAVKALAARTGALRNEIQELYEALARSGASWPR